MTEARKVLCIAGARPNFMKVAPILPALSALPGMRAELVHTGQHYDEKLSRIFFDELRLPRPSVQLEVGSGSHAAQTAEIMRRFEGVLAEHQPQAVLVVGDVNSTIACAVTAAKFRLDREFAARGGPRRRPAVLHVEAGLRSFDDDMPEEINRKLTDAISDLLFVSEPSGMENLRKEGVPEEKVFLVGNVMIDTLLAARDRAAGSPILSTLGVRDRGYGLVTLHRPSNVDEPAVLGRLLRALDEVARRTPLVFPVHPRTEARLRELGFTLDPARWIVTGPVGYLDFVRLMQGAALVLTDSGGVQEETTVLGVPCVTLRENTERPATVDQGTNVLAGASGEGVAAAVDAAFAKRERARVPDLWDGGSAGRIAAITADFLGLS
jgi:UDP-N-acetylglucosamine 2-epimerase (non-hydrolysing)